MKNRRALPIPFLILILAGLISLARLFAEHAPQAGSGIDDSLQVETVEQERMVAMYFRVVSWLADVTRSRVTAPAEVNHGASAKSELCAVPGRSPHPAANFEFCAMHLKNRLGAKIRRELN